MVTNIEQAEEKFNQFLPLVKESYPQKRRNQEVIQELIAVYEKLILHDNIVVGLFDDRKSAFFWISENFERITKYKITTLLKWGGLFTFKALHPSHYSFPFATYKISKKFHKHVDLENDADMVAYYGGLNMIDRAGEKRKVFLKIKPIAWTENNYPDISVYFMEDITHLMKGDHYWLKYSSKLFKYTYIKKKGKKEFTDLVSDSELRILNLLAKKKSNAEIASELHLSKSTVETHRRNMIKRVGAVDSTALVHLCKMANVI